MLVRKVQSGSIVRGELLGLYVMCECGQSLVLKDVHDKVFCSECGRLVSFDVVTGRVYIKEVVARADSSAPSWLSI